MVKPGVDFGATNFRASVVEPTVELLEWNHDVLAISGTILQPVIPGFHVRKSRAINFQFVVAKLSALIFLP